MGQDEEPGGAAGQDGLGGALSLEPHLTYPLIFGPGGVMKYISIQLLMRSLLTMMTLTDVSSADEFQQVTVS